MTLRMGRAASGWPEAVVFDLDGTLVDSAADIRGALNEAIGRLGLPPFSQDNVKAMIGGGAGRLVKGALAAHGVASGALDAVIADFLDIYEARATKETALYPGAGALLTELSAMRIKIGLCTNKTQKTAERILRDLGVSRHFGVIVGHRPGLPRKPDPAPLRAALEALGAAPPDSLMVGDSRADLDAARALGVRAALASYGYSTTPVRELGADAVIDSLNVLPRIFAEFPQR